MLLTHFGISGPVVLDMSRHWIASDGGSLHLNVLPGRSFGQVEELLRSRTAASVGANLAPPLPDRLAAAIIENAAGVPAAKRSGALTREERRRIVHALTDLPLPVTGDRGFDYAEVTAGGVPLQEVDPSTLQSRRCEGLFLCGEILDVDGRIGGFNFQWAWASGRLAGISAANAAAQRQEERASV
jgi:predicted Rossmann fold flavoprotein